MIILVTGGSSGLGESITRQLAENPDNQVYFTYTKSIDNAKKIETELENAVALKCDFRSIDEVNELAGKLPDLNIDTLINNVYSGEFLISHFHKIAVTDFSNAFQHNVLPTIMLTQAAIKIFRKKKFGKIITILTTALVNTPPVGSSVYIANKAYLQTLSKIWATENMKYNITSNTISPAFMLTVFTQTMDERLVEQIVANHPLNQLLRTEEVAECVDFFVKSTQQINGVDLILNSGINIK